jgi:glycosyltransferase involved in cell wall biosynthesis
MNDTADLPRVSVICIFLNGELFLGEAIDSVLAQNFASFELILVDDGSAAPATQIAQDYAARFPGKVRYAEHPGHANRGMSATRNLGLGVASGDLIAFIDADDVWSTDKLADQVAIMDRYPELGMVCGAVRYWHSWNGGQDVVVKTGHVYNRVVPPPQASINLYPLGSAAAPCPSDIMVRADLVERLGGFEAHFTGPRQMYEDQGFFAKLYLAAPTYFSDKVWLDYRQHPASIVAEVKRDGRYDEVRRYFLNWFEQYLATLPAPDPQVTTLLRRALLPYRHPTVYRLLTAAGSLAALPRRALGKLARTLRRSSARPG